MSNIQHVLLLAILFILGMFSHRLLRMAPWPIGVLVIVVVAAAIGWFWYRSDKESK